MALSFTDDEMMTERGTRVLLDCYENAPRDLQRIAPADVQGRRIGHFGFFRETCREALWKECVDWLRRRGAAAERGIA